jgi:hypothetical protein
VAEFDRAESVVTNHMEMCFKLSSSKNVYTHLVPKFKTSDHNHHILVICMTESGADHPHDPY